MAHAAEQGFVLLLPTGLYTAGGVATVVLTVILLAFLPGHAVTSLFKPLVLGQRSKTRFRLPLVNGLSLFVLVLLIIIGLEGPRDPLTNLMPLWFWTLFWIGFVSFQGLLGNLWGWVNPFAAMQKLSVAIRPNAFLNLPFRLAQWPAVMLFFGFVALLLADPAPSDPDRLAWFVIWYVFATALALQLFGVRWLIQGEFVTVFLRYYGRLGLFGRADNGWALGMFGWQCLRRGPVSMSAAFLVLFLLGSGSFDGLNETFWWLATIGVNPLEFPGRSAIILQTLVGLAIANLALIVVFAATLWLGLLMVPGQTDLALAFRTFAPSILPIALGYHIAHYLPSFLVDGQWALAALSDPFAKGWDLLGLGTFYVTTGFFNTQATVQIIWLSQAAAVVIGHVISILLAHGLAVRLFGDSKRATLSQLPLACFMIAYTFFGLWLLASPKGA